MDDFAYLQKRLKQEDQAASRARSSEAEMIHRALAAHYARRAIIRLTSLEEVRTRDLPRN